MSLEKEEREELFKLYQLTSGEMLNFHESHNKRIEWFVGIITAIVTAWVVGIFKSETATHYLLLALGAMAIIAVAGVAQSSVRYTYRFFLETISTRGKLEQILGWTTAIPYEPPQNGYWPNDAIVPERYLEGRRAHSTSDAWVAARTNDDANWWPIWLFRSAQLIGAIMFIVALHLLMQSFK